MIERALRSIRSSRLVRRDRPLESLWDIVWWWEARRLLFNVVVGAAGFLTLVLVLMIALAYESLTGQPFLLLPDPPIFTFILLPLLFGIGANACYTGGWIMESVIHRAWPEESNGCGTLSFTLGMIFAAIVTLSPAPILGALIVMMRLVGLQPDGSIEFIN